MNSRRRQSNMEKDKKFNYAAESDNNESIDDILANVDQFIAGIYRDINVIPAENSIQDISSVERSPRNNNLSILSSNTSSAAASSDTSIGSESVPVATLPAVTPNTRRNIDADIEKINRICDDVNYHLCSIGIFMNNENNTSNINLTSSPSSPPYSAPFPSLGSQQRNFERPRSLVKGSTVTQVIDLSETQAPTPEVLPQSLGRISELIGVDDDDDDVILVSANINPVVDLCTPVGQQKSNNRPRARSSIYQRRRLNDPFIEDATESSCGGSSSTIKRRCGYSHGAKTFDDNKKQLNNSTTSSTPYLCPVCIESCLPKQPTSTRCGHVFCKQCIEHAIRLTRKCPMCNTKISSSQIFRIYL